MNFDSQSTASWWKFPLWVFSGLLAVGVLAVTASYMPPVLKRLVLFYAFYGVACGVILSWLANEILPKGRKRSLVWVGLLTLVGGINLGLISYFHFKQGRQRLERENPKDVRILEALRTTSEGDPELQQQYEMELRQYSPWLEDFLAHRVSPLGRWKKPWPQVFWGTEIVIAAILAGATVRFLEPRGPFQESQSNELQKGSSSAATPS